VPYNDSTAYRDIARYYYYYPQCSPDVIAAHGLHHQQQQQQPVLVHTHDAGGAVVYHGQADENGGDGAETTATGRAGDGYGEPAVAAPQPPPSALRYYAKSPSAATGLVVDGCHRPMTAPVTSWTPADHGQFHRTRSRLLVKAIFHYAILGVDRSEAGRRPAASWNLACHWQGLVRASRLATGLRPASDLSANRTA